MIGCATVAMALPPRRRTEAILYHNLFADGTLDESGKENPVVSVIAGIGAARSPTK
jgi:hypothetical protein